MVSAKAQASVDEKRFRLNLPHPPCGTRRRIIPAGSKCGESQRNAVEDPMPDRNGERVGSPDRAAVAHRGGLAWGRESLSPPRGLYTSVVSASISHWMVRGRFWGVMWLKIGWSRMCGEQEAMFDQGPHHHEPPPQRSARGSTCLGERLAVVILG